MNWKKEMNQSTRVLNLNSHGRTTFHSKPDTFRISAQESENYSEKKKERGKERKKREGESQRGRSLSRAPALPVAPFLAYAREILPKSFVQTPDYLARVSLVGVSAIFLRDRVTRMLKTRSSNVQVDNFDKDDAESELRLAKTRDRQSIDK